MEKEDWEKSALEKVLLETVKEQRLNRRWRIFFRLIWLIITISLIYLFLPTAKGLDKSEKKVAVINLKGIISDDSNIYNTIYKGIEQALKDKHVVAVIIKANSPGGSPVYSNMLFNEILRFRKLYPNKPIDVVIEEVCASGCYYIAAAADKIYANPSSIVGSIGVIYTGFGLTGLMQKVGVDSRLLIAGKNKAMGYPFIPVNKDQEIMQQKMLNEIHDQFINAVKKGRGKRLLLNNTELFSGRYWLGADGLKLGLIDGIASVDSLARDKYKSDNVVDYTPDQDPFERIAKKFGVGILDYSKQLINSAEFGSFN